MTRSEITQGIKDVIARNSRYRLDEIAVTDPLDKFISSFMKGKLAREVKREFSLIGATALTNQLYESIKKVNQLIDFVNSYYNPEA
jgi:hypothetical protein